MAHQRLCEGCPLRESAIADSYDSLLEGVAYDVDNPEDRARLEAQPNSEQLMAALALSGVDRCTALARELPPPPRRRKRGVQALACPEFRLMSQLVKPGDGELNWADSEDG